MYGSTMAHGSLSTVLAIGLLVGAPSTGNADTPSDAPPSPYPDQALIVTSYDHLEPSQFFTASTAGVWFLSPLGLSCGIWDRGSFGCTGDIRGAPPGTNHIGWVNGNIVTRYDQYDPLLPFQFPAAQADRTLPTRSYVTYNGTTCATMADTSTNCPRGPLKVLLPPPHTWPTPP